MTRQWLSFAAPDLFVLTTDEGEVLDELRTQASDRGLAVLGGAMIDDMLKASLTWSWLSGEKDASIRAARKRLIGDGGSALTFSTKIELAYVTGLVGSTVYSDLGRLRDIRNDFSHWVETKDNQRNVVGVTFELTDFKNRCAHFKLVDRFKVIYNGEYLATDTARDRYLGTCMILYAALKLFVNFPTKENKVIDAVLKCSNSCDPAP